MFSEGFLAGKGVVTLERFPSKKNFVNLGDFTT